MASVTKVDDPVLTSATRAWGSTLQKKALCKSNFQKITLCKSNVQKKHYVSQIFRKKYYPTEKRD